MVSLRFLLLSVWTGSLVLATPTPVQQGKHHVHHRNGHHHHKSAHHNAKSVKPASSPKAHTSTKSGAAAGAVAGAGAAAAATSNGGDACVFTDANKAMQGKSKCKTITLKNIQVPAKTTLKLDDLITGTTVIFEGNTTFGYAEWDGPLIDMSGTSITVKGAPGAFIDGQGYRWWDDKGTNGGKKKPQTFNIHGFYQSVIENLHLVNTPAHAIGLSTTQDVLIQDVIVDDSLGNTKGTYKGVSFGAAANTDGFDIGKSTNVTIKDCTVYNQDDCLAINSGTDITFTGGYCSGGHGLSIGSVGGRDSNVVKGVKITNSKVVNSSNGIRVKTIAGGQGSVSHVTYDNISLQDIKQYGIVIQQDYLNGKPTGTPTKGVPITDLTVSKVTGNVKPGGANFYILCGNCSKWTWTDNKVVDGTKDVTKAGVPSGVAV